MAWNYQTIHYELFAQWVHYFITITNSNAELFPLGNTENDASLNLRRVAGLPLGLVVEAYFTWETEI